VNHGSHSSLNYPSVRLGDCHGKAARSKPSHLVDAGFWGIIVPGSRISVV
jgi:hypothetical protein